MTLPVAGRLPGFAVVRHVGRTSGRAYRTPVNVFRRGETSVIALTYGRDRDWVKNVLAAGRFSVEVRGRVVELAGPRIVSDRAASLAPAGIRPLLRGMRVSDFLIADAASDSSA